MFFWMRHQDFSFSRLHSTQTQTQNGRDKRDPSRAGNLSVPWTGFSRPDPQNGVRIPKTTLRRKAVFGWTGRRAGNEITVRIDSHGRGWHVEWQEWQGR